MILYLGFPIVRKYQNYDREMKTTRYTIIRKLEEISELLKEDESSSARSKQFELVVNGSLRSNDLFIKVIAPYPYVFKSNSKNQLIYGFNLDEHQSLDNVWTIMLGKLEASSVFMQYNEHVIESIKDIKEADNVHIAIAEKIKELLPRCGLSQSKKNIMQVLDQYQGIGFKFKYEKLLASCQTK